MTAFRRCRQRTAVALLPPSDFTSPASFRRASSNQSFGVSKFSATEIRRKNRIKPAFRWAESFVSTGYSCCATGPRPGRRVVHTPGNLPPVAGCHRRSCAGAGVTRLCRGWGGTAVSPVTSYPVLSRIRTVPSTVRPASAGWSSAGDLRTSGVSRRHRGQPIAASVRHRQRRQHARPVRHPGPPGRVPSASRAARTIPRISPGRRADGVPGGRVTGALPHIDRAVNPFHPGPDSLK